MFANVSLLSKQNWYAFDSKRLQTYRGGFTSVHLLSASNTQKGRKVFDVICLTLNDIQYNENIEINGYYLMNVWIVICNCLPFER